MVPSIKKQMQPKTFYEKPLNKSKGILDDHAIRKSLATRELNLPFTLGSVLFMGSNGQITQDNSNLFWNVGRTQLEANLIKITSDGTQAAPALKFNDTNTGFFKSGDSIRFSLNNSTKMTVDATGVGIGTASPDTLLHIDYGTSSGVEDDGSMTNNTFDMREDFVCQVGSAASSPKEITITAEFKYTAD